MQKRIVAVVLGVFFFSLSGCVYGQFRPSPDGIKLERTLQLINSLYVDDADTKKLTEAAICAMLEELEDRKSTRLNSSHVRISYAVFCLKKKNKKQKKNKYTDK